MSEKLKKIDAFLTAALICLILSALTVADMLEADRGFSATENRVLASRPEFSWESLFDGSFSEKYEDYVTDQFVGRDKWIGIKTNADILLQKKEINGVYLGRDDYLIEQHLAADYSPELVDKKLKLLKKLVKTWDAKVMLVPTADNILIDKLPSYADVYDQRALLKTVADSVGSEHYIDVYSALWERQDEEIYYRTDHHWTTRGAYYGYLAWAEAMGETSGDFDMNDADTLTEDFLGTLHSKINVDIRPDKIQYFPITEQKPVRLTYDLEKTTDTFYEKSYLETKNKYGCFLDDNHAFIEIETGCQNGKTLFVIKDSYANCIIPLLALHYEKIYVVDLRYMNGKLFPFMKKYEPEGGMDVLVLYNCVHFLEEFRYY